MAKKIKVSQAVAKAWKAHGYDIEKIKQNSKAMIDYFETKGYKSFVATFTPEDSNYWYKDVDVDVLSKDKVNRSEFCIYSDEEARGTLTLAMLKRLAQKGWNIAIHE